MRDLEGEQEQDWVCVQQFLELKGQVKPGALEERKQIWELLLGQDWILSGVPKGQRSIQI